MKKLVYAALLLSLCFTLAGCGKDKDETAKEETTQVSEDSGDEVSEDSQNVEETAAGNPHELFNESEEKSVSVTVPEGFAALEHMSASWLGFEKADDAGDGSITLTMLLQDGDQADLRDSYIEGINYQASANADDGVNMSEITDMDDDISYFNYNYTVSGTSVEGAMIWRQFPNETVFVLTVEDAGPNAATVDAQDYIGSIVNNLEVQ